MKNKLESIINLKLNNFEIKLPEVKGDKPVDVQGAEIAKKYGNPEAMEKYPWDECVADQLERYGDEETARKVCGAIKAAMQKSFAEGDNLEDACWPGYSAIGLKEKDGKLVPNCVPLEAKVVKEGFPVPSPESGEKESDFMGRCMSAISGEYPQDQAVAICISTWQKQ